jgi:ribonuclease D
VAWREETARSADRPASTVLNDAALVEIARRRPADTKALGQIRGVNEPTLRRRGAGLLDAVARGREQPPIPPDGQRPPPPDAADAPIIALGEALVRTRAMEAQLAYELIAARADLERIVRAQRDGLPEPETRTLTGWRRELVGEELLELLAGRRTLRVGADRAIEITSVD